MAFVPPMRIMHCLPADRASFRSWERGEHSNVHWRGARTSVRRSSRPAAAALRVRVCSRSRCDPAFDRAASPSSPIGAATRNPPRLTHRGRKRGRNRPPAAPRPGVEEAAGVSSASGVNTSGEALTPGQHHRPIGTASMNRTCPASPLPHACFSNRRVPGRCPAHRRRGHAHRVELCDGVSV